MARRGGKRYSRPHTIYKLSDGRIVPGVTSVIAASSGAEKVNNLIRWANRLGKEGYDAATESALLAEIGSCTHELIRAHLKQVEPDLSCFAANLQEEAQNCFDLYLQWEKAHTIKPSLVECPMVSEQYGYGGTLDLYAEIDGRLWLVDFKTGGVYDDAFIQSAAYRYMLLEHGYRVDDALVLQIPRKKERFAVYECDNWQHDFEVFLACLHLYNLRKAV